jgi:hypothetical protein
MAGFLFLEGDSCFASEFKQVLKTTQLRIRALNDFLSQAENTLTVLVCVALSLRTKCIIIIYLITCKRVYLSRLSPGIMVRATALTENLLFSNDASFLLSSVFVHTRWFSFFLFSCLLYK